MTPSKEEIILLESKAMDGEADAQCTLGWYYYNGMGVTQDLKKAAELYQQAADQGSTEGRYNLAWCYEYGEGVVKDLKKAVDLYRVAGVKL
jgi:hypothetical protein